MGRSIKRCGGDECQKSSGTPPCVRKHNLLMTKPAVMESDGLPGFELWLGVASILLAVFYIYRNQVITHQTEFE
jgi:hypothetical protein